MFTPIALAIGGVHAPSLPAGMSKDHRDWAKNFLYEVKLQAIRFVRVPSTLAGKSGDLCAWTYDLTEMGEPSAECP